MTVEIVKMLGLGLAAGVLSGLFGIGGGLVIVPALVVLFGFPIKTAVGTSLFALLLPTGLLGVWEYWKTGNLEPAARALHRDLGLFFGAYFGADFAASISQAAVKRLYAVFLLIVGAYFLLSPARTPPASPAPRAAARGRDEPPDRQVSGRPVAAEAAVTSARNRFRYVPTRLTRPLTARLVLVDRPDIAVGVAEGEFAPAPCWSVGSPETLSMAPASRHWLKNASTSGTWSWR